jgi:hypothetical protein
MVDILVSRCMGGAAHMHGVLISLAVLSSACFSRSSVTVYVAPSAHRILTSVEYAASRIDSAVGADIYHVEVAESEALVAESVVIRRGDLPCIGGVCYAGTCERTPSGTLVIISDRGAAVHIAHELLHAAGLVHVPDAGNIMARAPYGWMMTPEQIERVLHGEK